MLLRLLLGQAPLAQQLLDQRMVLGDALELAAVEAIGAAVADMGEGDLAGADVGRGQRRPHPGAARVRFREGVDLGVGVADGRHQAPLRTVAPAVREALGEVADRELGCDLAGLRAAHAVGDDEDGGALEVGVLVGCALVAGVGSRDVLGDADHHPSS